MKSTPLGPGTIIGPFEIEDILDISAHGITYRALDTAHGRDVAIQEYLPVQFAERGADGVGVQAQDDKKQILEEGLTRFLQEARVLAQVHDPYVSRLLEYTEANDTAYLVTEYEAGQTLRQYLLQSKLDEAGLQNILIPILKGLRVIHSAGLLHRDVNPSSIFLRQAGPPKLIGFGSTDRAVIVDHNSLDSRVTPGYSPIEQYHEGGNLGPWTDLYALGATMYRCIAGVAPVEATKRVASIAQGEEDPLVPAMEIGRGDYSTNLLGNIDWMLHPVITERPDSAGALLGVLSEGLHPSGGPPRAKAPGQEKLDSSAPGEKNKADSAYRLRYQTLREAQAGDSTKPPLRQTRPRVMRWWLVSGAALTALIGIALWQTNLDTAPSPTPQAQQAESAVDNQTTPAQNATTVRDLASNQRIEEPTLEQTVDFGREDDDMRADVFRELERNEQHVQELMGSALAHAEAGRLTFPPGENALADYRAILGVDPDHVDAKQGIDEILSTLVAEARRSFEDNKIKQAETQLAEIEHIQSNRDDAVALRRDIEALQRRIEEEKRLAELERQRQAETRRQRIAELLEKARLAMEQERLTTPEEDNALRHYRELLKIDDGNESALNGISDIGRRYLNKANQAIVTDNLDQAEALLITAATVQANADTVALLREQLRARRQTLKQQAERQKIEAEQGKLRQAQQQQQQRRAQVELNAGVKAYYRGDYEQAFRLLNPLAEADNARAQFRVGVMYNSGRGVERNPGLAEQWIRKALPRVQSAATAGAAWAQADLGSLYEDGLVVAKNDVEAVRWYRLAARQGYAGAQTNLGVMYANGAGVEADIQKAIRWLRSAAAQGDKIAKENLATLGAR